jgi:serine/threonine protein kinase
LEPVGSADPDLAVLVDELTDRLQAGEAVDLEAFLGRHPEHAGPLRQLVSALEMIGELKRSAAREAATPAAAGRDPRLEAGELGDFRIIREIGRGGMGVVYEAEQRSLGRRVALKILPLAAALDSRQLQRFQLEAHAAACLHQTNIVPVHAVGCERGVPFYAMQYIEGRSLAQILGELRRLEGLDAVDDSPANLADVPTSTLVAKLLSGKCSRSPAMAEQGPDAPAAGSATSIPAGTTNPVAPRPLPASGTASGSSTHIREYIRTVAQFGVQVAEALDHAHTRGILHRDIKPGNLLLDDQGQLWVTDFGLAQVQGNPCLTLTGDIVGTLRYMSPEQSLGKRVVIDGRTEIYSLGVTLYELLTLRPAIEGQDRQEILRKIAQEEPVAPRKLNPAIPRDLETILLKATAKEPTGRYATAKELADELRRLLEYKPIRAKRVSAIEQFRKWCRRNPALAAAIAAVATALLAVTVLSVLYADRQRHFALEQAKSLAESNRLLAIRNFDRGQAAFEKGEIGPGMLWMIESWRSAVAAGDPAWQHAARANLAAWRPHYPRLKAVLSHNMPVNSAGFSPDGRTVICTAKDGTAQLWDAAGATRIGPPLQQPGPDVAAWFAPDGKTILTGAGNTARLWDATTGEPLGLPLRLPPQVHMYAAAIRSDGKIVMAVTEGNAYNVAQLWDGATGRPIGPPLEHHSRVHCGFSADGKILQTTSEDGTVRFWDAATGTPVGLPWQGRGGFRCAAFSPDGKTILTGGLDGTAQLWDAVTRHAPLLIRNIGEARA